jgi:hypothetical protein
MIDLMEQQALERIVQNLHARDIASFPVECANPNEDRDKVHARMEPEPKGKDFSHMPVRDAGGCVVGVIRRIGTEKSGFTYDEDSLDGDKHVIDATDLLSTAIKRLSEAGFLLVKSQESGHPDGISGIINHADVLGLEVRLLMYTRTMQLEKRVLDAIRNKPWDTTEELRLMRRQVEAEHRNAGEQRSCPEAYLGFPDLMRIGQVRKFWRLANRELALLRFARNFACHFAVDAPGRRLGPDKIPTQVERCVSLLERLLRDGERPFSPRA